VWVCGCVVSVCMGVVVYQMVRRPLWVCLYVCVCARVCVCAYVVVYTQTHEHGRVFVWVLPGPSCSVCVCVRACVFVCTHAHMVMFQRCL
jgi:hypothetical protein